MKLTPEQVEEAARRFVRSSTGGAYDYDRLDAELQANYRQTVTRIADTVGPAEPTEEHIRAFMDWMGPAV